MAKKKKVTFKDAEKALLEKLATLDPTSDDYKKVADALNVLREANAKGANTLSKDAVAKVAAYVGLGVIMLIFECENPIRSKVISLLPKPKL